MEKVNQIIERQRPHFKTISPSCTLTDALSRMSSQNTDYLIVMDDNDKFLGLLTEHDVASKSIFMNKPLAKASVTEMMNTRLPFADVEDTVEQCMRVMKKYHVRHLPVFKNLHLMGIVTTDDILNEAVSHRKEIFD
jgi:signal-transduction protein with cAMP-binding, CBS, and nucleotidyltransferase domain